MLADVPGSWQPAQVNGTLIPHGWGAALGYPVIRLGPGAGAVEGFLFTSDALDEHWGRLDVFEGDGYERVLTEVHLEDGGHTEAFIYVHHEVCWSSWVTSAHPPGAPAHWQVKWRFRVRALDGVIRNGCYGDQNV